MAQLQRIAIAPSQVQNQQILLTVAQQHYLVRVLRLREGDRFIAIDGRGQWWLVRLEADLVQAQILESLLVQTELPLTVTLIVALPKGNGFDEVVRCCTEMGVACVAPVVSDRTLLHPSPQKLERWRRIASEAAEQSERQIVPTILDPVSFAAGLFSTYDKKYICIARGDPPHLLDCLLDTQFNVGTCQPSPPQPSSMAIATGPEGGWTPAEIEQAKLAGFQPVSLGRRILRAVTAPLVALSLVASAWESESRNTHFR